MSNMKTKEKCPMRCPELKIKRADVNSRKLLNKIKLNVKIIPIVILPQVIEIFLVMKKIKLLLSKIVLIVVIVKI